MPREWEPWTWVIPSRRSLTSRRCASSTPLRLARPASGRGDPDRLQPALRQRRARLQAVGAASVAGLFRTGRSESSSDVAGGGAEGAGAEAGGAGEAGPGLAGGAAGASSAGFGFALARRKTGGPSTGSGAGFDMTSLRLAAASFAAAIAAFDCQVPFPIQVLLPCRALLTVNSP